MATIYDIEAMESNSKMLFSELLQYITDAVDTTELHEVEKNIFEQLQKLGLSLLKNFIARSGTGYQPAHRLVDEFGKTLVYKGTVKSPYFSIFGELIIERARYQAEQGGYSFPLDSQLNLPEKKYSYLLQKWLQAAAVETNYQKATELLNDIFDYTLFASMPQRIGKSVSSHVDDFNAQTPAPDPETEGSHLGISADGKGIRMLPSERENQPDSQAHSPRLGRGKKRGVKKQSTVTVDFSFTPVTRSPEDIVAALLKERIKKPDSQRDDDDSQNSRRAQNKHLYASLDGKDAAMEYLMQRVIKRDPQNSKPIVVLLDGDPNLRRAFDKANKRYQLGKRVDAIILDIIHVAEYIWEVGTALNGEYNDKRVPWVREKLLSILHGNVRRVIGGFKQMITKRTTTAAQKRVLQKAITYFENHIDMMYYQHYLAKGYPIATGLVEGACNCLVKDRMEQSGMRWSKNGAEAILKQRAVKLNGDWQAFWDSFMAYQKNVRYPMNYKLVA